MSLVNKIIQDLEQRQALSMVNKGRVFRGLSPVDNPIHKTRLLTANLVAVILFLLVSVSTTYALMGNRDKTILQGAINDTVDDIEFVEIKDIEQNLVRNIIDVTTNDSPSIDSDTTGRVSGEPALQLDFTLSSFYDYESDIATHTVVDEGRTRLSNIEISEKDNNILLNLGLASEVIYRTYELSNPHRIVVEIDNVEFDGMLPDLTHHPALRDIFIHQNDAGTLLLVLTIDESYSTDKIEQGPTTQGYELSFSLVSISNTQEWDYDHLTEKQLELTMESPEDVAEYGEMKKNVSRHDDASRFERMFSDAQELYRRGGFEQATDLLSALLNEHANHKAARSLLINILLSQGQLQNAEELLKESLTTQVWNVEWANLYARLLVKKGDLDTALVVLERVTPDINDNPDYHAFLAALYQKSEQHEKAVRTYRQVLEVKPANNVWWMGLAISLEFLDQKSDALFAYNKALSGNPMSQDLQKFVHGKINFLKKRS